MLRKILISLLITNNAIAGCDIPTEIKKGDTSTCDGYVISSDLERTIRTDQVYKDKLIDNLLKIQKSEEHTIEISNEQIKIYEQKLREQQGVSDLQKVLYFSLGAAVTGLVAYGTIKALR